MHDRVTVRAASAADAEAIALVHVTAWQQTYRHLVNTERLDALDPADRVERWRDNIRRQGQAVFVGELDAVVVAWASTALRDPTEHPRALEITSIYALAHAHGSGVGQALLDAAVGEAGAFLWVAVDNPRAQAFYRRNGFRPDGQTDFFELLGSPVAISRWVR